MKHRFAILCESTIVDAVTNNVSLINLIDEIRLKRPPEESPPEKAVVPFRASVVVLTERTNLDEAESGTGRIVLRTPDDGEMRSATFNVDLSANPRLRTILKLEVFPVAGPGVYQFEIAFEDEATGSWDIVDRIPVSVKVDEEATAKSSSDT